MITGDWLFKYYRQAFSRSYLNQAEGPVWSPEFSSCPNHFLHLVSFFIDNLQQLLCLAGTKHPQENRFFNLNSIMIMIMVKNKIN